MHRTREQAEALFLEGFEQVEATIRRVALKSRLADDERQELYSRVMLKMVRGNYAVLRKFRGESRLSTFLTVTVQRVLLDLRTEKWGRWRPCAWARRRGEAAIELDRRVNRDGLEPDEAVSSLEPFGLASREELRALADELPRRPKRFFETYDAGTLTLVAEGASSDQRLQEARSKAVAERLRDGLEEALASLTPRERELLGLRFGRGFTVRRIAATLGLDARPLYRELKRLLACLREALEGRGLSWGEVAEAMGTKEIDLRLDLCSLRVNSEFDRGMGQEVRAPGAPHQRVREIA